MREAEFGEIRHKDGVSPAWPLGYDAFEPFCGEAERLFYVHGQRGDDPIDFWLQSEDLPLPESRVSYRGGKIILNVEQTNQEAAIRLRVKLQGLLAPMNAWPKLIDRDLYLDKGIPLSGTAHQAGTMRFGIGPATSVLDLDCKAHELDNLYVTDAGFFPSISAVNPTLTIIANALRVADAIGKRMGG